MPSWSTATASPVKVFALQPSRVLLIPQVEILGLCAQYREIAMWMLEMVHARFLMEQTLQFSREEVNRKMKLLESTGFLERQPNKMVLHIESVAQVLDTSWLNMKLPSWDKLPAMLSGVLQRSEAVKACTDA